MSSSGTGVPTDPTPRSPTILACSMEAWSWMERYRSGSPVLRPSVGFFSGLCCVIGAGPRIDWSDVDCRGR
jgi:hypothetical protein